MQKTWISSTHTIESQKVEPFTGEGAYHGSTKQKVARTPRPPVDTVSEATPTTLERYQRAFRTTIDAFEATYANRLQFLTPLEVPSQEAVRNDRVTFCWCPFEEAVQLAGPISKRVLNAMRSGFIGNKRFRYVDSKIQYFEEGDLPVDSFLWHVDGSIAVRDQRVIPFGQTVLHDLRARLENGDPPRYLTYQSSDHCATEFVDRQLRLHLPELVPNFNGFDQAVRETQVPAVAHPAGAILGYDGNTIHRAIHATKAGWRLWIRCTETDVEIIPSEATMACYGTVFRPRSA